MKKLGLILSLLIPFQAFAGLDNLSSYIFDSNGNVLNSTSNALNSFITNSTLAVTQSGSWTTGRTWTLLNSTDSVTSFQGTSPWVNNISQFGGSNVVTGTGASGSGIPRVTVSNDSNVLATQSGSWTVTANAGTNLNTSALALSANQTNGSQKTQVVDGSGNVINSDNPGTSNNQRLNVDTPDITSASTALGALNGSVSIPVTGMGSVGFQISSGTLIGTLQPQCSLDGGTTWANANFYNPATNLNSSSYIFTSSNPTTILGLIAIAGASHCRVTVSAYVSGTANAIMRASQVTGASGSIPSTVSLSNFFYDDMNVANGGIARGTSFVVSTLTTLYSHSGSGTVYGFTLNLQGLGGAQVYSIDLLLDGTHIFGASGISTADLLSAALYDISQVTTDIIGFAGWTMPDKAIRWTVPGGGQVSYSTSVILKVTQTAGGAGKFNAGLMALTR